MTKFLFKNYGLVLFYVFVLTPNKHALAQSSWVTLGENNEITASASNFTSLVTLTEDSEVIPYLAFSESNKAIVKRFKNGVWENVGGVISSGNSSYIRLAADHNNKLYISYVDESGGNKLAVKIFDSQNKQWISAGTNLYASSGSIVNGQSTDVIPYTNAINFDNNNVPYVAYGDFSNSGYPHVKKLVAGIWETVGANAVNNLDRANSIDINFTANNTPYIVYHTGTSAGPAKAYRYVNNLWENLNIPETTIPSSRTTRLTIDKSDNIYINYSNTSSGTTANTIKLNADGTWSAFGGRIGSGSAATYTSTIATSNGDMYLIFRDNMSNSSPAYKARLFEVTIGGTYWEEIGVGAGFDGPISSYTSLAMGTDKNMYVAYLKTNASSVKTPIVKVFKSTTIKTPADIPSHSPKQVEFLDRGLIGVKLSDNKVFLSWRLLGTDPSTVGFNVYKNGVKLNTTLITNATNYLDESGTSGNYFVRPVINNMEQTPSAIAKVLDQNYLTVPLKIPAGGTSPDGMAYTYTANDCSVGDLDGDGTYEIVVKWDPTNSSDNTGTHFSGNTLYDAYKLDGTHLWRVDLGINIHSGAHYTPFTVYDLDGDGKAELACRVSDGAVDGLGNIIGNPTADYRNETGSVRTGPEYLVIFNGETGALMAKADYYPVRGDVNDWGDNYANRSDRFVDAVAYLDGERPSLITGRGYYTRLVRVAWDWRDGQLTRRWVFDSKDLGNSAYSGQGNHGMSIADVDGDGKDEVISGSCIINDNGEGLWSSRLGHGDALHVTDMDPDRPGLEMWACLEDQSSYVDKGLVFRDAKTGETLFGVNTTGDIGRAMAADIDPRYKGYEVWGPRGGLYSAKGVEISSTARPTTMNFGIWWDGDLQRELLDGITISKWNHLTGKTSELFKGTGIASNNSTKATPNLSADLFGDWREEVIWRTDDNTALRIYTTTYPTDKRIPTLMHDPQYRVAVAWQNSGYNQPPYPSFYIGEEMAQPPMPHVKTTAVNVALQKPVITANGDLNVCGSSGITLSSSAAVGNQWYKDDVLIKDAVFSTFTPTTSGTYTVIASNECCQSAPSNALSVTFSVMQKPMIITEGATTFAKGGKVKLKVSQMGGYSYKWYKANVEIPNANAPELEVHESGAYTVITSTTGCDVSSDAIIINAIPISNYKIAVTEETCTMNNDGKIVVEATEGGHKYLASLKVGALVKNYTFIENKLEINNLEAGNYELCITIEGQDGYKQCFNVKVNEPPALTVYAVMSTNKREVNIKLAGATVYHVELNGITHVTQENELTLYTNPNEANTLRVTSDILCQGAINEVLTSGDVAEVYPNPFEDVLNIRLQKELVNAIKVSISTTDGRKVYSNTQNNLSMIQLQLSHLPSGTYVLELQLEKSVESFKIIKK